MNCENVRELLNAYIDDLLDSKEKKAVEDHIASCPACRKEFDELTQAVGMVRGLDRVVPPPWFSEQVMKKIRKENQKDRGILRRLFYPLHIKLPVEALATVVIAVLAVYLYRAAGPAEMKPLMFADQAKAPVHAVQTPTLNEHAAPQDAGKSDNVTEGIAAIAPSGQKAEAPQSKREKPPAAPASAVMSAAEPLKKQPAPSASLKGKSDERTGRVKPAPGAMAKSKAQAMSEVSEPGANEEMKDAGYDPVLQERTAPQPVMIDLMISVADKEKAVRDISTALEGMKARIVGKYSIGSDTAIMAETKGTDARKVIEKLSLIGDVTMTTRNPDLSGDKVTIRIKVADRQSQVKP